LVEYRNSLSRLKDALKEVSGQKKEKEEEGGVDIKQTEKPQKRKHLKERNVKYLKRAKQIH